MGTESFLIDRVFVTLAGKRPIPSTAICGLSRVMLSTNVKTRNRRPSYKLSLMKSILQRSFGAVVGGRVHGGTPAWFVRLYDGKQPRLAKTFSGASAGGKLAALRAALTY